MTIQPARPVLRALRHEPLFVDDQAVAARLRAPAAGLRTPSGDLAPADPLSPELARWARAWLVCWHAALVEDERYGRDDPWTIALALDEIVPPRGIADAGRRAAVLRALGNAGVLVTDAAGGRVRAARELFTEHPAALAVDWPTAVESCHREPAALLVLRTLADLVVPLDAYAAVPRRDLVDRTGYQQKQVRVALRRLTAAGLLDVEGDVGTTGRYRFSPGALGRAWSGSAAAEPAERSPEPRPAPPAAPAAARDTAAAGEEPGGGGMQVVVGGVTLAVAAGTAFSIDPGFTARLEMGDGGVPRLVVAPRPAS